MSATALTESEFTNVSKSHSLFVTIFALQPKFMTQICRYIMTCGTDSDVRKWCNIDDDDPQALGTKNMNAIAVVSFVRIVFR